MNENVEDLGTLIKDDVIDVSTLLNYFLERFKHILLFSISDNSIQSLERLSRIIIATKKAQLAKIHEKDIESNP